MEPKKLPLSVRGIKIPLCVSVSVEDRWNLENTCIDTVDDSIETNKHNAPNTVMLDAILSAPPVFVATHSYWPAFSDVNCLMVRRDPSDSCEIINCPLLSPDVTSRPFQRQFITGGGVPRAMQLTDTSEPERMYEMSPI